MHRRRGGWLSRRSDDDGRRVGAIGDELVNHVAGFQFRGRLAAIRAVGGFFWRGLVNAVANFRFRESGA
jgi:hypothetical protein